MPEFPLGGKSKNYNSKKSREQAVNMIIQTNQDGSFSSVDRAEGLSIFASGMEPPVRSNLLVNNNFIYVVSGAILYRINTSGAITSIGSVGGDGRALLKANAIPGDSEIVILNGSGAGYIYSVALGLLAIADTNFFLSSSVTVLNERFWLARDGRNEIFGSDLSDGSTYNPLTFAAAEESPDEIKAVISKKSNIYLIGTRTMETWQSINDTFVPIRRITGASKEWGILAIDSLADINDNFAFLANDRTVRLYRGNELTEISDLDFTLKVKGNGTLQYPGFKTVDDAYGFFVNGPVHSTYYLTFPTEGWTWGYDLKTGLSHIRKSESLDYWRVNSATIFGARIICGDNIEGKLWILDPSNKTEGNQPMRASVTSQFISSERDMTIPLIEIDMEVAGTNDPLLDPKMIVSYTKDGGNTWKNKGHVSIGKFGEHRKRVPLRHFGRLVRNKDFGIRLEVTDAVNVRFYGAKFTPEISA